jgi:hypothetical protein
VENLFSGPRQAGSGATVSGSLPIAMGEWAECCETRLLIDGESERVPLTMSCAIRHQASGAVSGVPKSTTSRTAARGSAMRSFHAIAHANGPRANTCRVGLPMPVGDPALGQVIRREFQRNSIAIHDFDAVSPESSGHRGEDGSSYIELDGEHSGSELLDYLA